MIKKISLKASRKKTLSKPLKTQNPAFLFINFYIFFVFVHTYKDRQAISIYFFLLE